MGIHTPFARLTAGSFPILGEWTVLCPGPPTPGPTSEKRSSAYSLRYESPHLPPGMGRPASRTHRFPANHSHSMATPHASRRETPPFLGRWMVDFPGPSTPGHASSKSLLAHSLFHIVKRLPPGMERPASRTHASRRFTEPPWPYPPTLRQETHPFHGDSERLTVQVRSDPVRT